MKKVTATLGGHTGTFCFNESHGVEVDPRSVAVSMRAEQIMRDDKLCFGEALRKARRELPEGRVRRMEPNGGLSFDEAMRTGRANWSDWVEIEFGDILVRRSA